MKKPLSPVKIVLILVGVIAAIGIVTGIVNMNTPSREHADLNEYFGTSDAEDVAVISDMTLCESKGKMIDGSVFLPYDMVKSSVNKRFYYDEAEQLIIVTTPTEFISEELTDDTYTADARFADGTLYLSLPFIQKYTDMEVSSYTDPARIVINRTFPYQSASLTEDSSIRSDDNRKSPILEDGIKGEAVQIAESTDTDDEDTVKDGWSHVLTANGISGYIETSSLGETVSAEDDHVSAIGEYTHLTEEGKINLSYFMASNKDVNATLSGKLADTSGITVLCPTWFFINGASDVTSIVSQDAVKLAHDKGMKVWALINDFDGSINSKADTLAAISGTSSRQAIIQKVVQESLDAGIDGINVDIENVNEDSAGAYLEFLRELSVSCRNNHLVLSVDDAVPLTYSKYLDWEEQGIVTDYVVVMCYDEHYKGSSEAGSVASLGWVKTGIDNMISHVPKERVIAGIPFYTRLWKTIDNGAPSSEIMDMQEAQDYISKNGLTLSWDKDVSQHYAEMEGSDGTYQIWLEDASSIEEKMKVIKNRDVAGVAQWCLGEETSDVWAVISKYLT